jgi:hypothetical protein
MASTLKFRALRPDEIDVRVQSISKKGDGAVLLLYKDARVDMALLDEVVGPMRWQREHELINGNLYCKVSIWDSEINQWISKSDVGCESNTEATKGEASDSFKRACFNWGIGRELYTAPFTYVAISENERYESQGKFKAHPSLKFSVKSIDYTEQDGKRTISKLEIVDNKGVVRYSLGATQPKPQAQQQATQPKPQVPAENPNLIVALQEVKEAQSIADLSDIKKRWRDSLGDNKELVDALKKKHNAIINK